MKKIFSSLAVALLLVGAIATPVYAQQQVNETKIVRADETIDDDYFAAGDEVIIEGTVTGDAYVAAARVVISGTVNGDVIALGETIEITGNVGHDVRAAGGTISFIGAGIGDGISIAGETLSIDRDSSVGGGAIFAGSSVTINGDIGRGILGGGSDIRLDGAVGKSVKVSASSLVVDEQAIIEGNLQYDVSGATDIAGTVRGETVISEEDINLNIDADGILQSLSLGFKLWAFAAAVIIAGVLSLLFKRLFGRVLPVVSDSPGKVALYGLLALFAALPLAILLMITVIGIPLGLLIVVLWIVAIYMAKFFFAQAVGSFLFARFMPSRKDSVFFAMIIGLVLYYVLRSAPYVGFFVGFISTVVGLGVMLALLFNREALTTSTPKATSTKKKPAKQIA